MTSLDVYADPASRPSASWAGRLAVLKSRGMPDDDPRIIECRQALAYHRLQRTPAYRAAQRPRQAPAYTQDELRERRRTGLLHTYSGGWSLTAEIGAICDPLAQRVAAAPNPAAYWRSVDDLTLAVHGLVHAVVGLLAERDAQRRTAHRGVDVRGRSIGCWPSARSCPRSATRTWFPLPGRRP